MRSSLYTLLAATLLSSASGSPVLAERGDSLEGSKTGGSHSKDHPQTTSPAKGKPGFPHLPPILVPTTTTTPCTPGPTNYLVNPGFDDDTTDDDVDDITPWFYSGAAASTGFDLNLYRSAPNGYSLQSSSEQPVDAILTQAITLPADAGFPFTVTCDGFIRTRLFNSFADATVIMTVNGVACASRTLITSGQFADSLYQELEPVGDGTVTITGPSIEVVLDLSVTGAQVFLILDDFAVTRDITCPVVDVDLDVDVLGVDVLDLGVTL